MSYHSRCTEVRPGCLGEAGVATLRSQSPAAVVNPRARLESAIRDASGHPEFISCISYPAGLSSDSSP
jgi:hypothetical protein